MSNTKDEKLYCVYQHTNLFNNKIYIGITMRNPKKRWGSNGYNYRNNPLFYEDILKYGWNEGFSHEILFENLNKEEAESKEIQLIDSYDTTNNEKGYNRNRGGHSVGKMTEATKEKISKSNTGKRRTPEQRKHMSEVALNMTDEHKKKISEAHKALVPWNTGLVYTEEQKDKIKGNTYRPVLCVETGIIYKSLSYVSRLFNIYASNLSKVCNSERHTAGGFHWRYVDE